MFKRILPLAGALALTATTVVPAEAVIETAPGWHAHAIPTPDSVQGAVVRRGDAILVGQGDFGAGLQQIVRVDGGSATTIATGFNSLGGFALDAAGTLYVVDNGGTIAGAVTGDTAYAIPNALTRTTALPALGAEVVPSGSIPFAQDIVIDGTDLLVSDGAGPGAGRVVRISAGMVTNLITGLGFAAGLTVDGTHLLVGDVDASFVGSLSQYTLAGVFVTALASGLSGEYAQELDNDGNILVTGGFRSDFSSSNVIAIAPGGGVTERAWGFGFTAELFHDTVRDETLVLDFGVTQIAAVCRDADEDAICDADAPPTTTTTTTTPSTTTTTSSSSTTTTQPPITTTTSSTVTTTTQSPTTSTASTTTTTTTQAPPTTTLCDGVAIATPKVTISKLTTPAGDDRLGFSGGMTIPTSPAIDPLANGVRLVLAGAHGVIADIGIPAGVFNPATKTGWKANAANTSFTFSSKAGVSGIIRVKVSGVPKTPGLFKLKAVGKNGSFAVASADLPLSLTFVLDLDAQCGVADFSGPAPTCAFNASRSTLKCK